MIRLCAATLLQYSCLSRALEHHRTIGTECRRDDGDIPITICKQRTIAARHLVDGLMQKMIASYHHRKDCLLRFTSLPDQNAWRLKQTETTFQKDSKTVVWTIRSTNVQNPKASERDMDRVIRGYGLGADDEARNFCTSSSSLWEVSAHMCNICMLKVICNIERLNENI